MTYLPGGPITLAGTPNVAVTSHTTQNATLLVSSPRSVAQSYTAAFTNEFWRGVLLIVDVTGGSATPSVVTGVQYQDPITSTWLNYFTAATAITSISATQYKYLIYPGISATEPSTVTEVFEFPLPRSCRLNVVHGDADSLTYSVAAIFLL